MYNIITSEYEVYSCCSGYQGLGDTCKKIKVAKIITLKNPLFDKYLIKDKVSFIAEINNEPLNITLLKYELKCFLNTSVESKFHLLFSFRNVSFLQITVNKTYAIFHRIQNILTQPGMALWKTISSLYISGLPNQRAKRMFRSSRPQEFCKKGVLRNFTKFTGKHLCQSLFFNKVAGLRSAT